MADAAAQAGVPLLRFPGPGINGGHDFIDPLMERPDMIVGAQNGGASGTSSTLFPDAKILHLALDASVSAHDGLVSTIKVRSGLHLHVCSSG